jgi:hypothetical protein
MCRLSVLPEEARKNIYKLKMELCMLFECLFAGSKRMNTPVFTKLGMFIL